MRTYGFKLYHAGRNKKLHKQIDIACNVYNHCIALHRRYYHMFKKSINVYALQKHLAKLKQTKRFARWNGLGSQAIQNVTERIDRAYKLFFGNLKRHVRTAPPSFKAKRKYKSFTLKQKAGWKLLPDNELLIGKQKYKYHKSRDVVGIVKTVTIKRDSLGDLYVYFSCDCGNETVNRTLTGQSAGFDFGLKTFLTQATDERERPTGENKESCRSLSTASLGRTTASDGNDIVSPLFFKQNANAVKRANRKLSRKKHGSNNRQRAKKDLARLHKHVANQRRNWQFKLARQLCETYDTICVENLNIKAMQIQWGRKVSDLGHAQFVNILKHTASKFGTTLVETPRFYPSSKTCSVCEHVLDELPLSVREWTCPVCGAVHDRDRNAAFNILRVGTSTHTRDGVSLAQCELPSQISLAV